MKSRLFVILLRAVIGYMPPRWFRPCNREGNADMAAIAIPEIQAQPTRQWYAETPSYARARGSEATRLEKEAERLQLEVKAAAVRNTSAVKDGEKQAQIVKSFEGRARDTLRDMLDNMGRGQ